MLLILIRQQPHFVTLLRAVFEPYPQLILEYVPGGSLEDQEGLTAAECVSIVCQCTSALAYLHGREPPIVHRDIKPGNILIQNREADYIHVKFADFGLSKDYDNLSTICGSWLYLAPEVYHNKQYIDAGGKQRVTYTAAVDVWSLGVVIYELLCHLPQYQRKYECSGTVWCEHIIKLFREDFERGPDELRQFLLESMVVLRPEMRRSAQACHTQAELLTTTGERHGTRRTASYAGEGERTTIRYQGERSITDGIQSVIWRPSTCNRASASTNVSASPPPQSSALAPTSSQKRPTMVSMSSSSSERHQSNNCRDYGSKAIKSTSRLQLDPLSSSAQEWLSPGLWRESGEAMAPYDWNQLGDDNAHVEAPCPIGHLAGSSLGLAIKSPLVDYTLRPPSSQLSGEWERNCNVLSSYLPEQSTRQDEPGIDVLDPCRQIDNSWDSQEAADAGLLLQELSQNSHPSSRFR